MFHVEHFGWRKSFVSAQIFGSFECKVTVLQRHLDAHWRLLRRKWNAVTFAFPGTPQSP
jgi:hypothetical protein